MEDTVKTYIVRKGSPVWVCRGELPYTDKPYKFIAHKMKRDLIFPYPSVTGPGVIAIANLLPLIIERKQRDFSECFVETKVHPESGMCQVTNFVSYGLEAEFEKLRKPIKLSFLDLLEKGMSLFATGIDEYPVLAVFEEYVDEVEGDRWVIGDLDDGLNRHTLNPKIIWVSEDDTVCITGSGVDGFGKVSMSKPAAREHWKMLLESGFKKALE